MTIRKSAHPRDLPGVHPGLMQRLREAEEAETRGETPRGAGEAQKVTRPSLDSTAAPERRAQIRAIGLVEPAYRAADDGLARIAEQEPFRPGVDLDDIWDTLGEQDKIRAGAVERFRLEMEASLRLIAKDWQAPHALGGRLDARALRRGSENLAAEIAAYDYLLAPDSRVLLARFVAETHALIELCLRQRAVQGLESAAMYAIQRDLVHKLVYQELVSRRRGMGDRGIRRICGNIHLAEEVYGQLKRLPGFSPRERLLMRIIHVHQDLGYTAYAARSSFRGGRLHRAYGARIFTDELNRYRPLLAHQELQLVRSAVATHSSDELPFSAMRVLALVRAVDRLAPFAPFRVYKHLAQVDGATDYLDDLLERARAGDMPRYIAAKEALAGYLAELEIDAPLRDDIMAAFRPVERDADVVELGGLAGEVAQLRLDSTPPGVLQVTLAADPFAERYQALFDQQQDQLVRLARAAELSPEALATAPTLRFSREGMGALLLRRAG